MPYFGRYVGFRGRFNQILSQRLVICQFSHKGAKSRVPSFFVRRSNGKAGEMRIY